MRHFILIFLVAALPGCRADDDNDPVAPAPDPLPPGALDPSFGVGGAVTNDVTAFPDTLTALVVDGSFLYAAGDDRNGLGPSTRWRIEKRNLSDGALVPAFDVDGVVTTDFFPVEEGITDIAIAGSYLYAIGWDTLGASNSKEWRIEKRSIVTGALVPAFDGDGRLWIEPTTSDDLPAAIALDASYLYAVGFDANGVGPSRQWRIEKRDIVTGALVPAFDGDGIVTEDPTTLDDEPRDILIDGAFMYVTGHDRNGAGSSMRWRTEKRNLSDGALVASFHGDGIVTTDTGSGDDDAQALASDGTYLYIGGHDVAGAFTRIRVEKVNLSDGFPVTAFDLDGNVEENPSSGIDYIKALAVSGGSLYVAGHDDGGGGYRWRLEKRDAATGALDLSFDGDGVVSSDASAGDDEIRAMVVDATSIYACGIDFGGAGPSTRWRIEKRAK